MNQGSDNSSKRREGGAPSKAKNCAECRRLKIKCDRQVNTLSLLKVHLFIFNLKVPCSNCVKRGTAPICPDGQLLPKAKRSLPTSSPHVIFTDLYIRLILSNTEDLHAKIDELTERIRELEEALASLQVVSDPSSIFNPAARQLYSSSLSRRNIPMSHIPFSATLMRCPSLRLVLS